MRHTRKRAVSLLTAEQMRAWLALEGWTPYPEADGLCPAIYDGVRYLVDDSQDYELAPGEADIYESGRAPNPAWLKTPITWDDVPERQMVKWYEFLIGEKA